MEGTIEVERPRPATRRRQATLRARSRLHVVEISTG